jgi:hypothetical protein
MTQRQEQKTDINSGTSRKTEIEFTNEDQVFVQKINEATATWQEAKKSSDDRLIALGKVLVEVKAHCKERRISLSDFLDKTDIGVHKTQAYLAIRLAGNAEAATDFRRKDKERKRSERARRASKADADDAGSDADTENAHSATTTSQEDADDGAEDVRRSRRKFVEHTLALVLLVKDADPADYAETNVSREDLLSLANFLNIVAGSQQKPKLRVVH